MSRGSEKNLCSSCVNENWKSLKFGHDSTSDFLEVQIINWPCVDHARSCSLVEVELRQSSYQRRKKIENMGLGIDTLEFHGISWDASSFLEFKRKYLRRNLGNGACSISMLKPRPAENIFQSFDWPGVVPLPYCFRLHISDWLREVLVYDFRVKVSLQLLLLAWKRTLPI